MGLHWHTVLENLTSDQHSCEREATSVCQLDIGRESMIECNALASHPNIIFILFTLSQGINYKALGIYKGLFNNDKKRLVLIT